jgi:uncharacterized protein YdhG (YjbR/CyaY superfamily)
MAKPTTVAAYLRAVTPANRRALERLRKIICAAVPGVEEAISYGMPGFRHDGRWIIWIGAARDHCSLYGISGDPRDKSELAGYDTSGRGTLRFAPDEPLPEALVRKLVLRNLTRAKEKVEKKKTATKASRTKG